MNYSSKYEKFDKTRKKLNDEKKFSRDCNNLYRDIKYCLRNEDNIRLFKDKDEIELVNEVNKFIEHQQNKETYISSQKYGRNYYYLWRKYNDLVKIYFTYFLIPIQNPNMRLVFESLYVKKDVVCKSIKGIRGTNEDWNFLNSLIWIRDISINKFREMYNSLISCNVDPWTINFEREDTYGSYMTFLYNQEYIDYNYENKKLKIMVTTTSSNFIESKTREILNKLNTNSVEMENKLRYLLMNDVAIYCNVLAKKLASFKDLPKASHRFDKIESLAESVSNLLNNNFVTKTITFKDVYKSYIKTIKNKASVKDRLNSYNNKLKRGQANRRNVQNHIDELTDEINKMTICWNDYVFFYYITMVGKERYPSKDKIINTCVSKIIQSINKIINDHDPNINSYTTSASLECLFGFLCELKYLGHNAYDMSNNIKHIINGDNKYTNLDADIRFKIALRMCAHLRMKDDTIITSLDELSEHTSTCGYKFILMEYIESFDKKKHKITNTQYDYVPPFNNLSIKNIKDNQYNIFIEELLTDIEYELGIFINKYKKKDIAHQLLSDILILNCCEKKGTKWIVSNKYKHHINNILRSKQVLKYFSVEYQKKVLDEIDLDDLRNDYAFANITFKFIKNM